MDVCLKDATDLRKHDEGKSLKQHQQEHYNNYHHSLFYSLSIIVDKCHQIKKKKNFFAFSEILHHAQNYEWLQILKLVPMLLSESATNSIISLERKSKTRRKASKSQMTTLHFNVVSAGYGNWLF